MKYISELGASTRPVQGDRSRLQRSTIANNEDAGWVITLSDLTLLLFCFLSVWYVKQSQRDDSAKTAKAAVSTLYPSTFPSEAIAADVLAAEWRGLKEEIVNFIADAGISDGVAMKVKSNEIVISFKDAIPFASAKADLKPEALPLLEKIAFLAVSRPSMHLRVNGHSDDRPISTVEFPSNWELSSARASRVARYLIEKGVHPTRIEVHGFAYHRPRGGNENHFGREANRRVEISFMRGSDADVAQNRKPSTR
jgi:chemotaxis protein MotB